MTQTQIPCPQCRQLIAADIEQVFDISADPSAKQRFLSGQYNIAQCPHCGFFGNLATPLIYHDGEKELLLTFIPPELALPMPEQEKVLGKMINQVVDALPAEQRKGYLFKPSPTLSLQGLVERVLQEEGIDKETLDKQQEMVNLIQRLITISDPEALKQAVAQADQQIDREAFMLISQLGQASLERGDQAGAQALANLQQMLLEHSTIGKALQEQNAEMEAAAEELRALDDGLTREKLLELVVNAPNEHRMNAYVSLARGGFDYEFFQLLSEKLEAAEGDEKERLTALRQDILTLIEEIDKEAEMRLEMARKNVEILLGAPDIKGATMQNLRAIDDFFLQALNEAYGKAKEANDTEMEAKLTEVIDTLNEASQAAAGPDLEFVQALLEADDEQRMTMLEENRAAITPEFIESITALMMQAEQGDNAELTEQVRGLYRMAVRFSMQNTMNKQEEPQAAAEPQAQD